MMIVAYFCILALVLFLYSIWKPKNEKRPPGLSGVPIIGSAPSIAVPFLKQIQANQRKFGDIFYWRIGARDLVFLCSPTLLRKVFNSPNFVNRPEVHFTFDTWSFGKKIGIINSNGLNWHRNRRFVLHHLRDSGFGKSLFEDIALMEVEELIKDIKKNHLGALTDLGSTIHVALLNIIWKIVADIRFERNDEELLNFMDSLRQILTRIQGPVNILDMLPWLVPYVPNFVMKAIGFYELQKNRNDLFDYIRNVVNKKKSSLDRANPCGLIDHYLIESEAKKDEDTFNDESLLVCLADLFFGGTDTTSTTMIWVVQYLACYPDVQKRIQAEIDLVIPHGEVPELKHRSRMPFTEATIHEVLRITTLTPIGVFHAAHEDAQIEQYAIAKATIIVPFLYGCHRDPNYWEKPEEFYPEHFLDDDGKFRMNEAFVPFSAGRRSCPGESTAKNELFLFTTSLLQQFSFTIPEGLPNKVEISDSQIFRVPAPMKFLITERNT